MTWGDVVIGSVFLSLAFACVCTGIAVLRLSKWP